MPFTDELKLAVRHNALFSCCRCQTFGAKVYPIVPLDEGGSDTEDNAVALCNGCYEIGSLDPENRDYIREARDDWYRECQKRMDTKWQSLERLVKVAEADKSDQALGWAIENIIQESIELPRRLDEIREAVGVLHDKVWYTRHLNMRYAVEIGEEYCHPQIWQQALVAAEQVRRKYGIEELGPWTDFEWGELNGRMMALNWVLGFEWDFGDT